MQPEKIKEKEIKIVIVQASHDTKTDNAITLSIAEEARNATSASDNWTYFNRGN